MPILKRRRLDEGVAAKPLLQEPPLLLLGAGPRQRAAPVCAAFGRLAPGARVRRFTGKGGARRSVAGRGPDGRALPGRAQRTLRRV